jgi:hypothetical protein
MSVVIETSVGDLVIDLYTDERPNCCKSFLKLCKIKYFHHCLIHNIQVIKKKSKKKERRRRKFSYNKTINILEKLYNPNGRSNRDWPWR